ncbi:MAG: DUF3800 domain-containing protein [Candidatus Gracilibacteria bacterium]|jgi:hypothetical protein
MAYIFLDESGDLGFGKKSSKFFVITFLFVENKRVIEKVVSKTHAELKKIHRTKSGILHCFHEKPITRQRLLARIAQKNCMIMTIYLEKEKVYTKLPDEKIVLYNYVANILLDRIFSKKLHGDHKVILIASRKETNKFLNENFKNYLSSQIKNNHQIDLQIEIKTPHDEKALQAVDFISWSIYRKYEYKDHNYYDLFKEKIVEENPLYK